MAAIDDDSDQGESPSPPVIRKTRRSLAPISGNLQNAKSMPRKETKSNQSEQEESSEDDAVVPRGKVAARLRAQLKEEEMSASAPEGSGSGNAYSRIKKRLWKDSKESQKNAALKDGNYDDMTAAFPPSNPSPTIRSRRSSLSGSIETPKRSLLGRDQSMVGEASSTVSGANLGSDDDTSDLPNKSANNNRFQELVAKKRAEREAREAEEEKKRETFAKHRELENALSQDDTVTDDISDDDLAEKHLTQSARPTRKASKKALEEMNRETQRMNRNMQLAHQARTKKKISKDSLFARFNFRSTTSSTAAISVQPSSSTIPSSAAASDAEELQAKDSPLTSPAQSPAEPLGKSILTPSCHEEVAKNAVHTENASELGNDDLPNVADVLRQSMPLDKGKGPAVDSPASMSPSNKRKRYSLKQRPVRVRLPKLSTNSEPVDLDSESDLENRSKQKTKFSKSRLAKLDAFHRLPPDKIQEGRSLLRLRALAHLNSPDSQPRKGKPSPNISEMQISLQKRARMQALEERKAKIDDLKARGVLVQSAEEREKDQAEVEDLLEKARREADELQLKEKKAAKKAKIANGEIDGLDSSDDDEDYEDEEDDAVGDLSDSDEEESAALEAQKMQADGSGSETEEDEEVLELDEGQNENPLLDAQAEEGDEEEVEGGLIATDDDVEDERPKGQPRRARRHRNAIEDDEDDDNVTQDISEAMAEEASPPDGLLTRTVNMPQIPPMLGNSDSTSLSLGMTQAFAATMADTQPELLDHGPQQENAIAFFGPPPEPDLPLFAAEDSQHMVPDSQDGEVEIQDTAASHQINLQFSQSQLQYDTLGAPQLQRQVTELTDIPDPTQDAGFALSSPAPERFVTEPPSTVDTVIVTPVGNEASPVRKKRGRLLRRDAAQTDSDQEDNIADEPAAVPRDVFKAMKEKRQKKAEAAAFNKKKSEAKEMVEEQAAESEDEYAGLGGASDDESGGEEDENLKEMMDHSEVDVDERQLAALYA